MAETTMAETMRPGASYAAAVAEFRRRRIDGNKFPGFGLPVDTTLPDEHSGRFFLHALRYFMSAGISKREIRMMDFVNQITDKPNWTEKVFDETILDRWREEAKSVPTIDLDGDVYLSDEMFDYCVEELRDKAKKAKETGIVNVLDAELAIAKSDTVVSPELRDTLRAAVKVLEDVPDAQKDWHPGSDGKVLDLLHPSLFPIIYGKTRVLPYGKVPLEDCIAWTGEGDVTDLWIQESSARPARWGSRQWLPSDVEWTEDGMKIASYVNNLHPRDHADLYKVLEKFVAIAVPLWEQCLFRGHGDQLNPRVVMNCQGEEEDYILPDEATYVLPDDYVRGEDEDEDDYKYEDDYREWREENRILIWPEPEDWAPRDRPSGQVNLRAEFPEGLQVIFKLADICLTPENPEYGGGSNHIEGALNDRIAATALYYYDIDNITDSYLNITQPIDTEEVRMLPPQGEFQSLERWLGVGTDDAPLQGLGRLRALPGRMLAFPNTFQHQVTPFRLRDPTRPGRRRILAMFLVDPHARVLSTSVVPPQRRDWWARELRDAQGTRLSALPREIFDLTIDQVDDFPLSWEAAVQARAELMQERSRVSEDWEQEATAETFNFCEH